MSKRQRKQRTSTASLRTMTPPPKPWGHAPSTTAQIAYRQAKPAMSIACSQQAKLNTSDNWDYTAIK